MVDADPAELDLLKPDGSHAIPAPMTVTNAGAWMQTVILTGNGVYKILLDPQLANTGSADVQLFTVPADLSGPITPGTPLTVTTTAPGQNATYTFTGDHEHAREPQPHGGVDRELEGLRPEARRHESHVKTVGTSGGFGDPVKLPVGGIVQGLRRPAELLLRERHGRRLRRSGRHDRDAGRWARRLTVSTTVPGQNATRTFNGTAGQRISFNFTGVTMASVKVIVKAPGTSPPTVLQRHLRHRRRFRRPGDAARGPHRPLHGDDRPAGRIDGQA